MFTKNINNNQKKTSLKKLFALLFLFLATACEDYGCIDSDDFGEYEIYTFPVSANRLSEYCEYKNGFADIDQPIGIRTCVGICTSSASSANFSLSACKKNCADDCLSNPSKTAVSIAKNVSPGTPTSPEPNWSSAGGGKKISIEHNSQILITAQGNVNLGSETQKSIVVINGADTGREGWDTLRTTAINPIDNTNLAKFTGAENVEITLDGQFVDSSTKYFPDRTTNSNATLDFNDINYGREEIINGARRVFAYFIPFPTGYNAYSSTNFPLSPDPSKFICEINDGYLNCSKNGDCTNGNTDKCDTYSELLPASPTRSATDIKEYNLHFSKIFDIDNLSKETARYNGGTGFIRYRGDNLTGTRTDDVAPENQYHKSLGVTTLGKPLKFPNNQKDYAIKFQNIPLQTECSSLKYKVENVEYPVTVDGTTTYVINKKDLQSISYYNTSGDCAVDVFFYPFHEIEFAESGYIEFGIPDKVLPTTEATCKLKFKIFNNNNEKDEFANFNYPTSSASVNYRQAVEQDGGVGATVMTGTTNNPKKYFIRKGQILSFHPDSWKDEWTPKGMGNTQPCGVGFYVKLTPRPAVFCANKKLNEFINLNQDSDENNDCNLYYDNNLQKFTGCQEDINSCTSYLKNGIENGEFCPSECIPKDFSSCRARGSSDSTLFNYPSSCIPTDPYNTCYDASSIPQECTGTPPPDKCKIYSSFLNIEAYVNMALPSDAITKAKCEACIDSLIATSKKPLYTKPTIELQQCYDLENYTGTMEELKSKIETLSPAPESHKILEDLKSKGLKKLETFDGNYGNFYPLENTKKTNTGLNNLPIYKIKSLISIGRAGYIKFIILDDINTTPTAPDYFEKNDRSPSITFPTNSPLRVNIKSLNSLSNGAGLTIALCKEDDANSLNCSGNKNLVDQKLTFFNALPITEYTSSNSLDPNSNYSFNDFGQLIRIKEINRTITPTDPESTRECTSSEALKPYIGANFLCFIDSANSLNSTNDPSDSNKYRITFKIIDNETPSCKGTNDFQDCTPPDADCTKYKTSNPNWDGTGNSGAYCNQSDITAELPTPSTLCTKQYKCNTDKYVNNTGYYDVAVKIKRDSKVKVTNFIDSIISPILRQVDGFYKTDKVEYVRKNISFGETPDATETTGLDAWKLIDPEIRGKAIINIGDIPTTARTTPELLIALNPNVIPNPTPETECKNNCYISYVIKAIGIFNITTGSNIGDPCINSQINLTPAIRQYCEGLTECSVFLNKENTKIIYPNGNNVFEPGDSYCRLKQVYIEYLYSKSEKPLYKENQVRRIYNSILVNPIYKSFLSLSVVLMLSFYGLGFLMGVSELKQSEIVDRLIKIALIYLFTNPEFGWAWFQKFFVTFFKNGTDYLTFTMAGLFDDTNQIESAIRAGNFSNKSIIFAGVDRIVGLFLINDVIHKKIGALMFYNFFGILYVMIIYYSAIAYVYAISNAVLIYLTSQFFTSVLFVVGPIFFVFILFKQTKGFFDNWINALIGFALQQIFLIFTLSLFNTMLYLVIKSTLGYRVCWDSVWQINLPGGATISLLSFWTPQDGPSYLGESSNPSVEGSTTGIPTVPRLLSLWTICVLIKAFITQITDLAALLSGGMSATELGSSLAGGVNKMMNETQNKIGNLYKKSGARVMDRVDQKLFDSGTLAKQARKKAKNENSQDKKLKDKMNKDGDKAVSDYKVNNSKEFAGLSEAQKREKLASVKKDAMKSTALSMGKTVKETENLMKDKSGSKYQGDNVFGAMASIAKDRFSNGNLSNPFSSKSLNQKAIEVDTGMSKKEMKKAIKGMDDSDKRQEFIDNVKSGNIQGKQEGRTGGSRLKKAFKEAAGGNLSEATKTLAKSDITQDERRTAVRQLEASGDIAKLSPSDKKNQENLTPYYKAISSVGNMAERLKSAISERSDKDEEKILQRIQDNKLAQSFDKGANVDGKKIDKLESFAKYLEVKEGKNSKETQAEEKIKSQQPNQENIDKINKDSPANSRERLINESNSNAVKKTQAQGEVSDSKKQLHSIRESISEDPEHKKMNELNKAISKKRASSSQIKEFGELNKADQARTDGKDTFESKIAKRSEAKNQLGASEARLENFTEKDKKINEAISKLPASENAGDSAGGSGIGGASASPAPTPPAPAGGTVPPAPAGGAVPPASPPPAPADAGGAVPPAPASPAPAPAGGAVPPAPAGGATPPASPPPAPAGGGVPPDPAMTGSA